MKFFFPASVTFEGTALFEVLNFSSDSLFSESKNSCKSGTHYSMELI